MSNSSGIRVHVRMVQGLAFMSNRSGMRVHVRMVQGLGFTCEWACFAASSRSQDFGFGVFGVTYLALVAPRLV